MIFSRQQPFFVKVRVCGASSKRLGKLDAMNGSGSNVEVLFLEFEKPRRSVHCKGVRILGIKQIEVRDM